MYFIKESIKGNDTFSLARFLMVFEAWAPTSILKQSYKGINKGK